MQDTIIGAGILLLFLLVAGFGILQENRKRKKFFLEKMRDAWGKIPQREYSYEELDHISQYFSQREKKGFFVDDITWNDLNLDQVYALINQSISPVGDEYLYDLLRTPSFEEKELEKREKLICFFRENPRIRQKLQEIFYTIRKPGNAGFFEAIHVTREAPSQNGKLHMFLFSLLILSLLVFVVKPSLGVFCFLTVCVVNIASYYAGKQETDVYLTSFRCVLQLLRAQKALEKLESWELSELIQKGRTCEKALSGFKRGSSLVTERDSGAGGGLGGLVMDYVRMLTHLDLIKFNDMLKQIRENREAVLGLVEVFGCLESMISIASYREALPYYTLPVFQEDGEAGMEVSDLYHPLISDPVANSIRAKGGILVTGSNASGKSTFLKNVGVNALLAQTIHTCTAHSYRASWFRVMTSMALRDDIRAGESYYIVEIRSLKRILQAGEEEGKLLCIIDEVLRGTNTIERIGASSRILAELRKPNILSFAATHDMELSYILEELYENYHFEEEIGEKDIIFHYILKKGRVTTRNAIRLLEFMGYEQKLIEQAQKAVEDFEKTGTWEKLKGES